ncbi:hypothetical protein CRV24_000114 [Beauveria bassiana]|nr:hypothetical protein CRV24_000114 [Beauveria bassiana]
MDYDQLKILITQYDTERLITKMPPHGTAFLEAQSDVVSILMRTPSSLSLSSTSDGSLQHHIQSAAHQEPFIYCPAAISGSENGNSKAIRKFKTVSALAQHLESGACIGGEVSFWEAIKYIDTRLQNMGMPFRLTQGKET